MKNSLKLIGLTMVAVLAAAPLTPASADEYRHGGWGHRGHGPGAGLILGLLGAGAAIAYAATTVVTAPVRAVADIGEPAYPQPVYQQPVYQQPVYQQPVYEQPVYAQPVYAQPVYAQPVYAAPYPGYYGYRHVHYAYPGYAPY